MIQNRHDNTFFWIGIKIFRLCRFILLQADINGIQSIYIFLVHIRESQNGSGNLGNSDAPCRFYHSKYFLMLVVLLSVVVMTDCTTYKY